MSQPCATPQLRCSPSQQQQLQQQRLRRSGCSAARLLVAPVARHAGQGARATHSGLGVVRLVAAAIPVRYNTSAGHTEVCLVNSSKGAGLVLPKGNVERQDMDAGAAATREAREEAGVAGTVRNIAGQFSFESRRGKRRGRTTASVYVVDVDHEMADWQESSVRRRHWLPAREAFDALKHDWQREALISAGLVDVPAS